MNVKNEFDEMKIGENFNDENFLNKKKTKIFK